MTAAAVDSPQQHTATSSSGGCDFPPLNGSSEFRSRMQPLVVAAQQPVVQPRGLVVWERLEEARSRRYGLQPLRNFNVTRSHRSKRDLSPVEWTIYQLAEFDRPRARATSAVLTPEMTRGNTIAPFGTLAPKATCGYYFNMDTNNKKLRIGIPPSDLMKWRSDGFPTSAGYRAAQPGSVAAPRKS